MPLQSADNISDFESTQKKSPENVGLVNYLHGGYFMQCYYTFYHVRVRMPDYYHLHVCYQLENRY